MNEYDIARAHIADLQRTGTQIHLAERISHRDFDLIEKCRVTLRWRVGYILVRLGRAIAGSATVTN